MRPAPLTPRSAGRAFVFLAACLAPPQAAAQTQARCDALYEAARAVVEGDRADQDAATWSTALDQARQAQACYGDRRDAQTAELNGLALALLYRLGRHEELLQEYERFEQEERSHAPDSLVAEALAWRADALGALGRQVEALASNVDLVPYLQGLPLRVQARRLMQLGDRFRAVNDARSAMRYYAVAESLAVAHRADDPRLEAVVGTELLQRGRDLLFAAGEDGGPELAEAVTLLSQARALFASQPGSRLDHTQALLRLSAARRLQGDYEGALRLATEAGRVGAPLFDRVAGLESWIRSEQAMALSGLDRHEEARRLLEDALADDRARRDYGAAAISLWYLAHVETVAAEAGATPDYASAEALLREAIDLHEIGRADLGISEWSAASFETDQGPYRDLVRLMLRQGRLAEALATLDLTRARHLRDLRLSNRLRNALAPAERHALDSLNAVLADARYSLLAPDLSTEDRSRAQGRILQTERARSALVQADLAPPPPLDIGALQERLRDREQVLVTYFFDGPNSRALLLTPDTLAAFPLPASADSVSALAAQIAPDSGRNTEDTVRPASQVAPLRALYDVLIRPVQSALPTGASLVIIPEGPATGVPFAALVSGPGARYAYAELPYLVHDHAVSLELAAALLLDSALAGPTEAIHTSEPLLAFGRSRFGGVESGGRQDTLSDLPHVSDEIHRLQRRFPSGRFALNDAATEGAFKQAAPSARVVHLASHAFSDPTYPFHSRIVLSAADSSEDGTLYLYELQERPLAAALAVLSGCSTARGESRLGEGMIGLQHAFRAAGAASTLASLWQVDDRAMADLVDRFYGHLARGLPKDRALQRAQLDYLDHHDGLDASPFFWAAPVLYGDTAPLDLPDRPLLPTAAWLVLGLGLILAAFLTARRARLSPSAS